MEVIRSASRALTNAVRSVSPTIFRRKSPPPVLTKAANPAGYGYDDALTAMKSQAEPRNSDMFTRLGHPPRATPKNPARANNPKLHLKSDLARVQIREDVPSTAFGTYKHLPEKPKSDLIAPYHSQQEKMVNSVHQLAERSRNRQTALNEQNLEKITFSLSKTPAYNKTESTCYDSQDVAGILGPDESFVDISDRNPCDESFQQMPSTIEFPASMNFIEDQPAALAFLVEYLGNDKKTQSTGFGHRFLIVAYAQTDLALVVPMWSIFTKSTLLLKHHQLKSPTATTNAKKGAKAEAAFSVTNTKEKAVNTPMLKTVENYFSKSKGSGKDPYQDILVRYFGIHQKSISAAEDLTLTVALNLLSTISASVAELNKAAEKPNQFRELRDHMFGHKELQEIEQVEIAFFVIFKEFISQAKEDFGFSRFFSGSIRKQDGYILEINSKIKLKITEADYVNFVKRLWKLMFSEQTTCIGFLNLALLLGINKFNAYMLELTLNLDQVREQIVKQNQNNSTRGSTLSAGCISFQTYADEGLKTVLRDPHKAAQYFSADHAMILVKFLQIGLK